MNTKTLNIMTATESQNKSYGDTIMNTKNLVKLASAIALAACFSSSAQATPITGTIGFGINLKVVGGTNFATATGLDFITGVVGIGTGSYTSVPSLFNGGLTPVTFTDFSFAGLGNIDFPVPPTTPLWTFSTGTYSFNLATISINTHDASTLSLSGTGTLKITGYDDTPGIWGLTTQPNGPSDTIDSILTFSATNTAVPEPITLSMLGIGFATLARRKMKVVKAVAIA
jgi:hypothetical protein